MLFLVLYFLFFVRPIANMTRYFCETFGLYPQQLTLLFNISATKARRLHAGLESANTALLRVMLEALEQVEQQGIVDMLEPYIAQAHHDLADKQLQHLKRKRNRMEQIIEMLDYRVKEQEERYAYDVRFLALCLWYEANSQTNDPIMKQQFELARRVLQRDLHSKRFLLLYRKMLQKHYLEAEKRCIDEVLALIQQEGL